MSSTEQTSFVDALNGAIRENPLAATLVGAGVFWMLFGSRVPALASALPEAARVAGQSVVSAGQKGTDLVSEAMEAGKARMADAASRVSETARESVSEVQPQAAIDAVAEAGNRMLETVRPAVQSGRRYASAAQARLAENLERQPVLLGVLGLAIGAGIASAFPGTRLENEIMGAEARDVRAQTAGRGGGR